ncbi:MAG: response regulator transcription factor [Armatimonadota bacterium]|nr:response regulator transcription factor [Armatimonadota bacterium]MDR5704249.1 response regulator transcription factor [Armatimonadota bacterium]MDR7433533.1 response regulator transcription factor [Armatimonadota bacterium]
MRKVRVVIADRFVETRGAIKHLLKRDPWIEVVGEISSCSEVIPTVSALRPDALLIDAMGQMRGLEVIRELRALFPEIRIIALTDHSEEEYKRTTLAAGADCWIPKIRLGKDLLPMVRALFPNGVQKVG